MDILESLKNLNVSEECFRDIVGIVEYHICEVWNNNSGRRTSGTQGVDDSSADDYHVKKWGISYHNREMTPDQYIKRATSITNKAQGLRKSAKAAEQEKREMENGYSIDDLKNKITDSKQKIDIPYLDYHNGDQEGYHRAIAAKDAGIEKIPVRVFHSTKKGGNYIKSHD